MKLDTAYWEKRYSNKETGWDAGDITTPLKEYFDQLKDKSIAILVPGAGNSYEAGYLFKAGFKNVFILDYASEPLENFSKRNPSFPKEQLIKEDFFKYKGQYDLIIEQTFFCAIEPSLRPQYAKHMHELLKPGGRLVGLLFNDTLNKDAPPFGGNKDEYISYFEPYFRFNVFETAYNSIKPRIGRELFINFSKK